MGDEDREARFKRPFDLSVVVAGIVILFPIWIVVFLIVPAAIWLTDRGSVFYSQPRLGKNGRVFTVRKFRTMVPDAEFVSGAIWAADSDVRITRVGKILRKTALDEFPQVLNILRGEMSLVGPRAERPEIHAELRIEAPGFDARLAVRPGLTGLAQINGGYDLSPSEKLVFDLRYINSISLATDIRLITKSVFNTACARWDKRSQD